MALMTRIAWRTMLALGILAGPALGQSQQFPFTGVINADEVNVRAGAGKNYYAVTQLHSGTLVRVHGNLYGWYEIEPPADSFSYVAKRFVELNNGGPIGVIQENRVRVRAPSPGGPDKSYRRQMLANQGDRVKVIGEEGDFYKIEPPAEARLFIDERFVEKATREQSAAAGGEPKRRSGAQSAGEGSGSKPTAVASAEPARPRAEASGGEEAAPSNAAGSSDAGDSDRGSSTKKMKQEEGGSASSNGGSSQSGGDAASAEAGESGGGSGQADSGESGSSEAGPSGGDQAAPAQAEGDGASSDAKMKSARAGDASGGESASVQSKPKQASGKQSGSQQTGSQRPKRTPLPDPAEVRLEELPIRPGNDRLTQLERQYVAVSRRPLEKQPIGRLRMAYQKVLSEADLSRSDRRLAEARIQTLETREELKASLAEITETQRELTEAEKKRRAAEAKEPPEYVAVGRLTTSTIYTGGEQPLLYRLVNPLTQRSVAYVRPGGEDGANLRSMLGNYVGIEGETEYDPALKLHVIEAENVDELSASQRQSRLRRGAAGAGV